MRLAADANVLLSAVLGGRAKLVLDHPKVEEVVTTETTYSEVQEYAAHLAKNKRLSVDLVLLSVATLPVNVRNPDDVDLVALALHLGVPVWSNDNDFEDAGVEWYTTAGLLKKLGA